MLQPIYTTSNCRPAYQLRWSLALFAAADIPPPDAWLAPLRIAVETDGVRILEFHFQPPNVQRFLVSTLPPVAPPEIVKSVKGRLQHEISADVPKAFQRNFSLTSLGDAKREAVEAYVADQLGHHRMADDRVQERLQGFQLSFAEVDLSRPQLSAHGRYIYNLHLVLVNESRSTDIALHRLAASRDMFTAATCKKGHRVSRLSLFADHLHATIGCSFTESPEQVALGYLNNLAYAHGMTPVFSYGYYVGTFGEYDMGAVRRTLQRPMLHSAGSVAVNRGPTDAGSTRGRWRPDKSLFMPGP
ncbi:MAG: hypothetical protein HYS13_06490 [Planctomycetia bacterium]|nr:hypothetical protein [Planctomycetia bacterium]